LTVFAGFVPFFSAAVCLSRMMSWPALMSPDARKTRGIVLKKKNRDAEQAASRFYEMVQEMS